MKECSANGCEEKAISEIQIRAESHATDKKYRIMIYVCKEHYELEKDSIISENPITSNEGM